MRKYLFGVCVAAGVGVFSPAWGQEAELFDKLDANKDGVVTSDEVPDDKQAIFERLIRVGDANGDKKLSKDELVAGLKKAAPQAEAARAIARPGPSRWLPKHCAGRKSSAGWIRTATAKLRRMKSPSG